MSQSATLCLDTLKSRDVVGKAVRQLLQARGPLRIVSPYVSGKLRDLLALKKARWKDLRLLCDLDSGNSNPEVLKHLLEKGGSVRTVKGLHAKVYISSAGVAVGSANLTPNGLGSGLIEAISVVRVRAAIDTTATWFDGLNAISLDVAGRLNDPVEFAKLLAVWRANKNGSTSGRSSSQKHSLLTAILTRHPRLDDLAFSWYTEGTDLKRKEVKNSAQSQGIPLPSKNKEWVWFESQAPSSMLSQLKKRCRDKHHVAWRVKLDDDDEVARFLAHDPYATPFLGGFYLKGKVVAVMGDYSMRTEFNLRADRTKLAQVLTRGLRRVSQQLRREINNAPFAMLTVSQLTKLVEQGLPE